MVKEKLFEIDTYKIDPKAGKVRCKVVYSMLTYDFDHHIEVICTIPMPEWRAKTGILKLINIRTNWSVNELCLLIATVAHAEIKFNNLRSFDWFDNLPDIVKSIGFDTNGHILFKDQAIKLYCVTSGESEQEALTWVKDWNKKVPKARRKVKNIFINNISLERIIIGMNPYQNQLFFISRPIEEAKKILYFSNLNANGKN